MSTVRIEISPDLTQLKRLWIRAYILDELYANNGDPSTPLYGDSLSVEECFALLCLLFGRAAALTIINQAALPAPRSWSTLASSLDKQGRAQNF